MLRVFVSIANYGHQNKNHLSILLKSLTTMPFDVTIELLSESPKDYGPAITVRVGLPGRSPWTLPFAYKQAFLERKDDFDLYIYSEDDILITKTNIEAFLDVSSFLVEDVIAGFTRYELDDKGNAYYIDMFGPYHFMPHTIFHSNGDVFAKFSNEHSGCFMLTRKQLARVLSSPEFFQKPRKGVYGLPETAATEPYTQCGLQKVICVSRFSDFVVHHLPNKYHKLKRFNLATEKVVEAQRRAIMCNTPSKEELFPTRLKINSVLWDKYYYSPVDENVVEQVPRTAKSVLSVGCGVGATEIHLSQRGHSVAALPIDAIISSYAETKGIRVLAPRFSVAFEEIGGRVFDVILLSDVLQYVEDPVWLLKRCYGALGNGGILVVRVPNIFHTNYLRALIRGDIALREFFRLGSYRDSGLRVTSNAEVREWLSNSGFKLVRTVFIPGAQIKKAKVNSNLLKRLPQCVAVRDYVVVAAKNQADHGKLVAVSLAPRKEQRL